MTSTAGWVALAITIFSAFSYAAASILQAVGARRSTGTLKTLGHPLYLAGSAFDLVAWAGSMVALGTLAVYLVESVLAGSLAVTVIAARVFLKARLRRIDVAAIAISVIALTVLAMSAGPQEAVPATTSLRLWFCGAAVTIALLGVGAAKFAPPGVVAALAGLCLGGAALVGRALTFPDGAMSGVISGAMAVLTEPLIAALLVFGATGMLLYANALQRGQVGPVTAVLWIAEVIAPSAVAVMMMGDNVRPGWGLPALVAALITVVTAVILATAPANKAAAAPQQALPAAPERRALPAAPVAAPAAAAYGRAPAVAAYGPESAAAAYRQAAAYGSGSVAAAYGHGSAAAAYGHGSVAAAYGHGSAAAAYGHASVAAAYGPAPADASYASGSGAAYRMPAAASAGHLSSPPGVGPGAAAAAAAASLPAPERLVWWGPPPIWVPPQRPQPAIAAAAEPALPAASAPRELTWTPAGEHQPLWTNPLRPDADTTSPAAPTPPAPATRWPYVEEPIPTAAQLRPWDDL